jgi:hypothetical protein
MFVAIAPTLMQVVLSCDLQEYVYSFNYGGDGCEFDMVADVHEDGTGKKKKQAKFNTRKVSDGLRAAPGLFALLWPLEPSQAPAACAVPLAAQPSWAYSCA